MYNMNLNGHEVLNICYSSNSIQSKIYGSADQFKLEIVLDQTKLAYSV